MSKKSEHTPRGSTLSQSNAKTMYPSSASVGSAVETSTLCSIQRAKRKHNILRIPFLKQTRALWASTRSESTTSTRTLDLEEKCASEATVSSRKVRFSRTIRVRNITPCSALTSAAKADIWYTTDEREIMRRTARARASRTRVSSPNYEDNLDHAINNSLFLAATIDSDRIPTLLQEESTFKKQSKHLLPWTCRQNESLRGLEEHVAQSHRFVRSELVAEAREMVTYASSRKDDCNEIARQYKDITKASLILARLLAYADEHAARRVYREVVC